MVAPEANQAVNTETGGNTQFNVAEQNQEAENEIEISSEAKAEGKYSEAKAETEVEDNVIAQNVDQEQNLNQQNFLDDRDTVDVTAQNAAGLIAANVNIEDILIEILDGGNIG